MNAQTPAPLLWDLPIDAESELDFPAPMRFVVAATLSLLDLIENARKAMFSTMASRIEVQDWESLTDTKGRCPAHPTTDNIKDGNDEPIRLVKNSRRV